jgi:drug/metabolite transporter (DMT)-like permease
MKSVLIVLLGACSYGVLSTFVKIAYGEGFSVAEVTGSQVLLGAVILGAVRLMMGTKSRIAPKQLLSLILVGFAPGLTGIFYYSALQTIPASLAVVLLFQFTWMGVLLDSLLHRRWPTRTQWAALGLLFIGTYLAGDPAQQALEGLAPEGVAFGMLSALSYAVFVICSGKVAADVPPLTRSLAVAAGSAAVTFLMFPPVFLVDGSLMDSGLLFWGVLLALFGVVIPTLFFAIGVPKIGGSLATILGAAELPTAVLLSSAVLHETVRWIQWIGVAVIIAGIALPELHLLKKPAPKQSA